MNTLSAEQLRIRPAERTALIEIRELFATGVFKHDQHLDVEAPDRERPWAERFDSLSLVKRGRSWTVREVNVLRDNPHVQTKDLLHLLPGRSRVSVQAKRNKPGLEYRPIPWTRGEDEELRVAAPKNGPTGVRRRLPHRTITEIEHRAAHLGLKLFNNKEAPPKILGEPLADAIRHRAREDGISMRRLDKELGTGLYFTSCAALRVSRGSKPNMTAIRKAIEFFEAELVTGPDGTITIDWKDE